MREADHRIKNSLQLLAGMLVMRSTCNPDPQVKAALQEAIQCIRAIASTHQALAHSQTSREVAFDAMLCDVCTLADRISPGVCVVCEPGSGSVFLDAERAVPFVLVVNELITNAIRHAYAPSTDAMRDVNEVRVKLVADATALTVTVADTGRGMAEASSASWSAGLGSKIVRGLAAQIGATMKQCTAPNGGMIVTVQLPR